MYEIVLYFRALRGKPQNGNGVSETPSAVSYSQCSTPWVPYCIYNHVASVHNTDIKTKQNKKKSIYSIF